MFKLSEKTPLFDPDRQTSLQAFGRKIGYLFAVGAGAAIGILLGFTSNSWLVSLIVFIAVSAIMAGTTWLVTWRPTPTIKCLDCEVRGWIDDLVETNGNCPLCGSDWFNYYRYRGYQAPITADRIEGKRLVELRREIGLPWI